MLIKMLEGLLVFILNIYVLLYMRVRIHVRTCKTRDVLRIHVYKHTHARAHIRFKIHFVTFENVKVGTKCQRENNQPCFAPSRPTEPRGRSGDRRGSGEEQQQKKKKK